MCGIVGYVGSKTVVSVIINGLRKLEYRGYDSAGIAAVRDRQVSIRRTSGKLMNLVSKKPINPLIGSAGVSAVPMAARVSQVVAQKDKPGNFILMHAMGPNVAGVIGSAIAAGVFLSLFK